MNRTTHMKTIVYGAALVAALLFAVAGCGGSGGPDSVGNGNGGGTGGERAPAKMKVTIEWPEASRLIPDRSKAIKLFLVKGQANLDPAAYGAAFAGEVDFSDGTTTKNVLVAVRPESGNLRQTFELAGIDVGASGTKVTVVAQGFPDGDEATDTVTGEPQSFGAAKVALAWGQESAPFDIVMASTVTHWRLRVLRENGAVQEQEVANATAVTPVEVGLDEIVQVQAEPVSKTSDNATTRTLVLDKLQGNQLVPRVVVAAEGSVQAKALATVENSQGNPPGTKWRAAVHAARAGDGTLSFTYTEDPAKVLRVPIEASALSAVAGPGPVTLGAGSLDDVTAREDGGKLRALLRGRTRLSAATFDPGANGTVADLVGYDDFLGARSHIAGTTLASEGATPRAGVFGTAPVALTGVRGTVRDVDTISDQFTAAAAAPERRFVLATDAVGDSTVYEWDGKGTTLASVRALAGVNARRLAVGHTEDGALAFFVLNAAGVARYLESGNGVLIAGTPFARDVAVVGNYVYVLAIGGRLAVFDQRTRAQVTLPDLTKFFTPSSARFDVAMSSDIRRRNIAVADTLPDGLRSGTVAW